MEKRTLTQQVRSVFRWIGWVLLVQLILINVSSFLYAYKLTHFYNDAPETSTGDGNIFTKSWKLFTGPRYPRSVITAVPVFKYDTIVFTTIKGKKIEAWYGAADSIAKGTVLLFHGITNTRSSLMDETNEFRYLGYNVLMVDFRGHGNSEGNTTTIGVRESEEVKLAYEYVQKKGEKTIYLYGTSMGAVTVAKAIADNDLKPAGVILEMPFLSLQTYLKAKARLLGFPRQPFAFFTTFWIGAEKGFNGFGHKTTRYVNKINCPVLVQWGTLDNFVLAGEIQKIYNAITSTNKKLVIYEDAQHESFLRKDPDKWRREIEGFLSANNK
ncbi:MAG TPA: alpha/beta hydrolase [Chitinophagaceae bacterium]|nr:alpha/beta hydrolase [Chitinophagaceae bacterium]